jgi:hypothetical protein
MGMEVRFCGERRKLAAADRQHEDGGEQQAQNQMFKHG